ncbi:hypothetical protein GCM10009801_18850 [Streptomyces albiaxialis]|uniref:HTH araC/xylS-type domain-containing protein n=1 Tax=Streptomyces albiaxialis TaxID=329523 RepID=A0ABN2VR56_9ACTN
MVQDGPRQAPPLLLIHGSGASGGSWSPIVPALAGHHHVLRADLPGCGQSPPAVSYEVPEQAVRLAAHLDHLGLGPVTVVGHSSGGYVATALAERRPDLVRSIALLSTGPSSDALLPQPLALRVLLGPPFGPLLWSRRSDTMTRKGIRATAARPVDVPDDMVAEMRGTSYRTFRTVLRRNTEYLVERSVPERLAALDVPVLAAFGTADPRWEPSSVHQYGAVPHARVEQSPGVGHEDRLRAAASWDERFTLATDLLGRRRLDGRSAVAPAVAPEVAFAWRRTRASRGRARVEGLAGEVGWSRKRLSARFRAQLGITPRRAARLVRFDHATRLLTAGRAAADVAAESGYVDQSHLYREVKSFAGPTPTAVAVAPWLAIDDVAWPDSSPTRSPAPV